MPLTFYNVSKVNIDTAFNDRRFADDLITISNNFIAESLEDFSIFSGKGRDELLIDATLELPVLGLQAKFDGGPGIDRITAEADVDLTLTNSALVAREPGLYWQMSKRDFWSAILETPSSTLQGSGATSPSPAATATTR